MEVDASIEPPVAPAPTGNAVAPRGSPAAPRARRGSVAPRGRIRRRVRHDHLSPPAPGLGDVRLVTLHAHELMIDRVTIDGAPARVIRRGGINVGDDGEDVEDVDVPSASTVPADVPAAIPAADAARADARVLASGVADELVIARRDAGVVGVRPPAVIAADAEAPGRAASRRRSPGRAPRADVVIRVWYAAGTAAGDAIPDAWRGTDGGSSPPSREHEFGWSVPGYGALATHRDADDVSSRFLVAPGPAMRPAAWFPCVDDGASLVHFSANVTVESDLTVVAPGVLLRSELVDVGEDDGGERLRRRKFAFASGGVPTQAHQMVLAVGKFAARRIPASSSATSAFAAAAAAEEDKEAEEKEAAKRDATEAASLDERANAVDAHAHSSTHALFAPRDRGAELRAAATAAAAILGRSKNISVGRSRTRAASPLSSCPPTRCPPRARAQATSSRRCSARGSLSCRRIDSRIPSHGGGHGAPERSSPSARRDRCSGVPRTPGRDGRVVGGGISVAPRREVLRRQSDGRGRV